MAANATENDSERTVKINRFSEYTHTHKPFAAGTYKCIIII